MPTQNSDWKLVRIRKINGQIEVITGLRVGGSQDTMEISGLDNPIIRNPANDLPYIPGSSIKGKMRSLAEWYFNELPDRGDPTQSREDSRTARVFGISASKTREIGPTRLVVRDAPLSGKSSEDFKAGKPITEVKHENSINRLTAMANPRPMERVVPGVTFDFEIVYRVLDTGDDGKADEDNFENVVKLALALVQADFLGGAGSRGCGQVRFINLKDETGNEVTLPTLSNTEAKAG